MAIGPAQIEDNFKDSVKEFETIIDRQLQRASFRNSNKSVSIAAPISMSQTHFIYLKDLYLQAGWTSVEREYGDQRDPMNEIVFTK